jgi:hypothetical protein
MSPDDRRVAIARLLAAGVLRLHTRAALTGVPSAAINTESLQNPGANCLELGGDSRLTVDRS